MKLPSWNIPYKTPESKILRKRVKYGLPFDNVDIGAKIDEIFTLKYNYFVIA